VSKLEHLCLNIVRKLFETQFSHLPNLYMLANYFSATHVYIPTSLLKTFHLIFSALIAKLATLSFQEGCFNQLFKTAQVAPHTKKPNLNRNNLSNYRPINKKLQNIGITFLSLLQPYIVTFPTIFLQSDSLAQSEPLLQPLHWLPVHRHHQTQPKNKLLLLPKNKLLLLPLPRSSSLVHHIHS